MGFCTHTEFSFIPLLIPLTLYLNSKAEKIINESDIDDVFESINSTIKTKIQKSFGKGLC